MNDIPFLRFLADWLCVKEVSRGSRCASRGLESSPQNS